MNFVPVPFRNGFLLAPFLVQVSLKPIMPLNDVPLKQMFYNVQ